MEDNSKMMLVTYRGGLTKMSPEEYAEFIDRIDEWSN